MSEPDPLNLHQKSMELWREYFINHRITYEQYMIEINKLVVGQSNPLDIAENIAEEFDGEVIDNA